MRKRTSRSDYHLLVAQNFLSNISRSGTHEDTNLRIFNNVGLCTSKPSTSSFDESAQNKCVFHLDSVQPENDDVEVMDAVNEEIEREDFLSKSLPPLSSRHKEKKKTSLFKRFVKIVSSDDVIGYRDRIAEESNYHSHAEFTERKVTDLSLDSCDDGIRPDSPVSLRNFPFFRRLRTSLGAKGDRYFLCSETSSAPLTVISHFSFLSHDRRRLRRSRSTLAASTERVRNISQCSIDELRPYSFHKDSDDRNPEYTFGHLLGRKRGNSPAVLITHKGPESRTSHYLESALKLFSQDPTDTIDVSKDGTTEIIDEIDWEEPAVDTYDPSIFEDVETARKTVFRTNGFVGITFHSASADFIKSTLNEKFVEKFPDIELSYSKFKSIKNDIVLLAGDCNVDLVTTSQAFVYFEKIVLKGLISKFNRKIVGGVCLLVAAKLNDYNKECIKSLIENAQDRLRVSRKDLLAHELPLCAALQFDLYSPTEHIKPHYQRLVLQSL